MKEEQCFDIHADDFAISINASQDIIDAIKESKLNSISIVPNMKCFESAMELLGQENILQCESVRWSVHLNFMEGQCCADPERLNMLVTRDGFFQISWGKLFVYNYLPSIRGRLKRQLKQEIKEQILRVAPYLNENQKLRIDSHQHTHMIPVVFQSIMEVIKEERYGVEFIRVAREPLWIHLKKTNLLSTYKIANIIKNLILNFYSVKMVEVLRRSNIRFGALWGIMMSGNMDQRRVEILRKGMLKWAISKNQNLEVLFHPGSVLQSEITDEYQKSGFVKFHRSAGRKNEMHTIMSWEKSSTH